MPSELPCIGFFPALPLEKNIQLGEWDVGKAPRGTPWLSTGFKRLSQRLIRSFGRRGFKGSAMLWHRDRGFDGVRPPDEVVRAIHAAVTFSVLDANDRLDDLEKGRRLATSENTALHITAIDETAGHVVHRTGGALRGTLVINARTRKGPPPLADAVESISHPVSASAKLAVAMFDALIPGTAEKPHIRIAAEWHRAAMANPDAVTLQQRLIAIKTGFEALLGTSRSWPCAKLLQELFEKTTAAHKDLLPSSSVLWSPKEKIRLRRRYGEKNKQTKERALCDCSELEDWFMTLAAARNSVIHDGKLTILEYSCAERPRSRYAGHLFFSGERLLREAIKATLGPEILLCGPLANRALGEALWEHLRALPQGGELAEEPNGTPGEPPPPAPLEKPDRDLPTLLGALACQDVRLVEVGGHNGSWGAKTTASDGTILCDMNISATERDLLVSEGAEEEVPDHWLPCD